MRRPLLCLALGCLLVTPLLWAGQDPSLADRTYNVQLRYRIDAGRQQRYRLFHALVKRLAEAGFQKAKGLEGEELFGTEMTGTMPGRGLPALLENVYVQTAILTPTDFQPGEEPVLVRFYLTTALGAGRQKEVADRARELLKPLGFVENVGADDQEATRLLGRLPAGQLKDILKEKWNVPVAATVEPGVTVVKVALIKAAVVLPEPEGFQAPPAAESPASPPAELAKVSPELRAVLAGEANAEKSSRVEVILRSVPPASDPLFTLRNAGLTLQGRLGPVVFGELKGADLTRLAALPEVSGVRLPQPARDFAGEVVFVPVGRSVPAGKEPLPWVRQTAEAKAIVIASDFRGFEGKKGGSLPTNTRLLDFTGELSPTLTPEPAPTGEGLGEGTRLAEKLVQGTGIKELLLVRIDAAAPFQIESVAQAVAGRTWQSTALLARIDELRAAQSRLDERRKQLRVLRRLALDNFGIDESAKAARENYRNAQAEFEKQETELRETGAKLLAFQATARELKGAGTVLIGLAWTDGYGDLPGGLPVLRFLDAQLLQGASWLQAVPVRQAAVWQGLFRDGDDNGVMEYVEKAPSGQRADLNFLAWQPKEGAKAAELPAGLQLRVQMQWQEAHDPKFAVAGDDPYRQPIAPLRLTLLRQRDPSGKKLPADVFDVVARSDAYVQRLENDERASIYQVTLTHTLAQPGRYALLVEGKAPTSLAPPGSADVTGRRGELRPKLVLQTLSAEHRGSGKVIFGDYHSGE